MSVKPVLLFKKLTFSHDFGKLYQFWESSCPLTIAIAQKWVQGVIGSLKSDIRLHLADSLAKQVRSCHRVRLRRDREYDFCHPHLMEREENFHPVKSPDKYPRFFTFTLQPVKDPER